MQVFCLRYRNDTDTPRRLRLSGVSFCIGVVVLASEKTRKMVTLAVLAAVALVITWLVRIPIAPTAMFLKYDPKDIILLIAGFLYGPLAAGMVSLTVSLIEMITVSESGVVGLLMNVMASCAFVFPAALLYRKKHTLKGAIVGMVLGTVAMTVVMMLWNYFITPFYMGVPRAVVVGMMLPVFLPFNLIKGILNASLTLLVYKSLANVLRKTHRLPAEQANTSPAESGVANVAAGAKNSSRVISLVAVLAAATCVGGILLWQALA